MKLWKKVLTYIFSAIVSPLIMAGQKYNYLLYSENSKAVIILVKVGQGGSNQVLAATGTDFYKDKELKDHAGNIAVTRQGHPELEFPETAKKLTERVLAEQAKLVDESGLKTPDAELSFVIAVAGYETIHGAYPQQFPPDVTRRREELAKANIVSVFANNGLKMTEASIHGCGDQDFILQIANEITPRPNLSLFKATYDILFLAHPPSLQPDRKWESLSEYQYTSDHYERIVKKLPKGGSYSLGFIMGDRFFSKRAVAKEPLPCFGHECSRIEQERVAANEYRKELLALYPDMTQEDMIEYFQGFRRNNELGDRTLELAEESSTASVVDIVSKVLIQQGGKQLVRSISRQLPVLKDRLHKFQSDDQTSDIVDIYVIGSNQDIYDTVPVLNAFMNKEGQKHRFRLKQVPDASWPEHTSAAVVHLTNRLTGSGS